MDHIEQATRLKRAINEARVNLLFSSECITEDELTFRRDTLVGILIIADQETKALIENWTDAKKAKASPKMTCSVHHDM